MQLFVYGTLKEPGRLRAVLGSAVRWRVLGPGTVCGALYDCGEYPALVASRAPHEVVPGLLLEFEDDDALAPLDAYEGVDSGLYAREQIEVHLEDGRRQRAWSYVYTRSIAGLRRIGAWPLAGREGD
jgi:gamma-glutamylcyclotransferase (GGCT)/AIG2-like uncharacterized protein YtfP